MSLIINHRQIDEDLGKILYQLRSELTNGKLKDIIDRLENIYREVLGAELCNWSCLMNNFYKEFWGDDNDS